MMRTMWYKDRRLPSQATQGPGLQGGGAVGRVGSHRERFPQTVLLASEQVLRAVAMLRYAASLQAVV